MLRKFTFLILLLLGISLVNSASVYIYSHVHTDHTRFDYKFVFNENESYSSFSFEKPREARIISARDSDGNILGYNIAGSYFIFRPEETANKTFYITLTSAPISEDVILKNTYSNYINFNFPVDFLRYTLFFEKEFATPDEIFPRNYLISREGEYIWELNNIESDTLFLVNFKTSLREELPLIDRILKYILFVLFFIPVLIIFIFILIIRKKKNMKKENLDQENQKINKDKGFEIEINTEIDAKNQELPNKLEIVEEKNGEKKYLEYVEKYLTENEREVAGIVKQNEGISQYDILNFIPTMTKSNLSKIISKLHNKKILNRIRVGKVNKIYLGEKLSFENSDKKVSDEK